MSVAPGHHPLPPTSSLPPLRQLHSLSTSEIHAALRNLHAIYCPLPQSLDFQLNISNHAPGGHLLTVPVAVDSGYASEIEGDNDEEVAAPAKVTPEDALEALRCDTFERDFATRWLAGFVARAEAGELSLGQDGPGDLDDNDDAREDDAAEVTRQMLIDEACAILASFSDDFVAENDEVEGISRTFSFPVSQSLGATVASSQTVDISLHDAPIQTGADHTDVGLQTWGASIVLAELMCADPARFGFSISPDSSSDSTPLRVVELGAGTGLLSLVFAKLLPRLNPAHNANPVIIATDFHPVVLSNLRVNVVANKTSPQDAHVETSLLDWSAPDLSFPLDVPADILVAADVVYEPEHAVWLRDCAARMLAPKGVFWLMASVRPNGRFEGLSETVREVFGREDCPGDGEGRVLAIRDVEMVDKRNGVGRADECGYKLFRIEWV